MQFLCCIDTIGEMKRQSIDMGIFAYFVLGKEVVSRIDKYLTTQ